MTVDTEWAVILHSFAPLSRAHVANQYASRGFIARGIRQLCEMVGPILELLRKLPPTFLAIFVIFCHARVIPPHRPIKRLQQRFSHSLDRVPTNPFVAAISSKSFPRSTPFVGNPPCYCRPLFIFYLSIHSTSIFPAVIHRHTYFSICSFIIHRHVIYP